MPRSETKEPEQPAPHITQLLSYGLGYLHNELKACVYYKDADEIRAMYGGANQVIQVRFQVEKDSMKVYHWTTLTEFVLLLIILGSNRFARIMKLCRIFRQLPIDGSSLVELRKLIHYSPLAVLN